MTKIAIIGTGISGLGAAHLLHPLHEVTVYEKDGRPGGHSRTLTVRYGDRDIAVDTGFIVFNRQNYPHFHAMLRYLGVPTHNSNMTFAATVGKGRFEWGAKDLNSVFGQRRNILRPGFYRILRDVMRFNALALPAVEEFPSMTLGMLVNYLDLSEDFQNYYLLPMGGAIWSCPLRQMLEFPARSFVRFFANHGLLQLSGQPQWYTVTGGAQSYVQKLSAPFAHRIRLNTGVRRVIRNGSKVDVVDDNGHADSFDHVIFACPANEARKILADADAAERQVLGAFRYQENHAVLHKDISVMPKRRRCWASWVYQSHDGGLERREGIAVSYWMNLLQGIDHRYPLFVTLNSPTPLAPEHVFDRHVFMHPVFDSPAIAAQKDIQSLQGVRNTWFCGAHLRNGFHEDGLWSAVSVATRLGAHIPWAVPESAGKLQPASRPGFGYAPSLPVEVSS